jgi:hypothetical protein
LFVASHHAAASGDVVSNPADLRLKPKDQVFVQNPPMSVRDQVHWFEATFLTSMNVSSSGAIVESNNAPTISQFQGFATPALGLFDQYAIYSLTMRVMPDPSGAAQATTATSFGKIYTAIDFDSNANLASETAIMSYGTCQSAQLVLGKSYERFCHPVVTTVTGTGNSSANSGTAGLRAWVNNAFSGVPHYGFRILTIGNSSGQTILCDISFSAVIAMRNSN